MTVHEELNQFSSSSSSGGDGDWNRSSKKTNEKKAARRGLGVAQLEKLRMKDLQKKNEEKDMLPLPTQLPDVDNFPKLDVCWPPLSFPSNICLPKLRYPCEVNHEWESPKLDQFGLTYSMPLECDGVISLPDSMQRMQYQYQHSSSPSVNVSLLNAFNMEPPSNQSYYSDFRSSLREEEKIIGLKRPYPFPFEPLPAPAFLGKFPSMSYPNSRSDDSAWCRNYNNLDNAVPVFRESASCPRGVVEPNTKRPCRENVISCGELLAVSLPSIIPALPTPRFKHATVQGVSHSRDLSNSGLSHNLGSAENRSVDLRLGGSKQRPFFKFLHEPKNQVVRTTRNILKADSEIGEGLDLNLKL
ncbi:hypothetical protein Droror1_Dr00014149 [Drosera rotundifolia]